AVEAAHRRSLEAGGSLRARAPAVHGEPGGPRRPARRGVSHAGSQRDGPLRRSGLRGDQRGWRGDDAPRRSHVRQASLVRPAHQRCAARARCRAARLRHRSRRRRAAGARARRHHRAAGHDQGARLARGHGRGSRRLSVGRRGGLDAGVVSYIDETLLPDEHVVYRTALHWIIFARGALMLVTGVAVLVAVPHVPLIGVAILLVGIVLLIPPFIDYQTTELGVTNKRMIVKIGFVRRRTLELLLRQVEALSVDQSLG